MIDTIREGFKRLLMAGERGCMGVQRPLARIWSEGVIDDLGLDVRRGARASFCIRSVE